MKKRKKPMPSAAVLGDFMLKLMQTSIPKALDELRGDGHQKFRFRLYTVCDIEGFPPIGIDLTVENPTRAPKMDRQPDEVMEVNGEPVQVFHNLQEPGDDLGPGVRLTWPTPSKHEVN